MTRNQSTRRRFLKAAVVTGSVTGLGGLTVAQNETISPDTTIKLNGVTPGWEGVAPQSIAGESNPTLNLQSGAVYTLLWQNGDGVSHNIAFQDEQGENLSVIKPVQASSSDFEANQTSVTENQTQVTQTQATATTAQATTLEGDLVNKTEFISQRGAVQGLKFQATDSITRYICLVHPNTMVADVSLGGGTQETGNQTTSTRTNDTQGIL